MGEFLDQPAKLSPELRERKGNAGITPDKYQILSPSSNHIYTLAPQAGTIDVNGVRDHAHHLMPLAARRTMTADLRLLHGHTTRVFAHRYQTPILLCSPFQLHWFHDP